MGTALNYIWYIFDKLITWFFDDAELFTNVTLGWVLTAIIVFGLLIRSLLNVPRGARTINTRRLDRDQGN